MPNDQKYRIVISRDNGEYVSVKVFSPEEADAEVESLRDYGIACDTIKAEDANAEVSENA